MRKLPVLGCMLLVAAVAPLAEAQTRIQETDIHLMIIGDTSRDHTTVTAAKGQPVLTGKAVAPRAARLKQDVQSGGLGDGVNFKQGDLLFGRFDRSVWTYCGISQLNTESRVANGALLAALTVGFTLLLEPMIDGTRIRCFRDADRDGVFESAWGTSGMGESALVLFDLSQQTMSAATPYERVAPRDGPPAMVNVNWSKGSGATIQFSLGLGGLTGDRVTAAIPAPGGEPTAVKLSGLKLKLIAYDATKETITVEIEEGFRDLYRRIDARQVITTTYY